MSFPHRLPAATVWLRATLIGLASAAAILAVGALAWWTQAAMLAPPLGATAYLCFRAPAAVACAPRNVLLGHALALLAGWVSLLAGDAASLPPALAGDFTLAHAEASALSILLTVTLMAGLGIEHPPACATTLVVALGVLRTPPQLAALELGALVITALAWATHRARGVAYPTWAPRTALAAGVTKEP